jgi:sugar phosphate isomerase/epimerase
MKTSIVISTQPSKFSALRFDESLEEGLRNAAELGYDGVELAVREPARLDIELLHRLLRKYHLAVPAIGTGQAFVEEGLSFTEDSPQIRQAALDRIKEHIDLAEKLDSHVIIGLIRGLGSRLAEENEVRLELLEEALRKAAEYAVAKGVDLFLEPLNRYETALINTIAEGIGLIGKLECDNLKLLIDTFHMNIEEASLYSSILKALPYTGHVHFADSNRHAPGSGHLGFADIVSILFQAGYKGYVSMEMLPLPNAEQAAKKSIHHLREILANMN